MRNLPAFLILIILMLMSGLIAHEYPLIHSSETVAFYSENKLSYIEELSDKLSLKIDALQIELGIYTDEKAQIYITTGEGAYKELSLGKDKIVEFSNAFYDTRAERIYIKAPENISENYLSVLFHEYLHWYLDQVFMNAPLWFHEGMATYYSGQLGYERYLDFIQSSFWGQTSDLFLYSFSYPENKQEWQNYYISSYFAIRWMKDKEPSYWKSFWDQTAFIWRKGYQTDFIPNFRMSYGMSLWSFNQVFRTYLRRQARIYLIVGINSIILAFVPLILLLAARRRRRRRNALPDLPYPEEPALPDTESPEDDTPGQNDH